MDFFGFLRPHLEEVAIALVVELSDDFDSKVCFEVVDSGVCVSLGLETRFANAPPARLLVSGPASKTELLSKVSVDSGPFDWWNPVSDVNGVEVVLQDIVGHQS